MKLNFSTKAGTLSSLTGRIRKAKIQPLVAFKATDWQINKDLFKKEILEKLGCGPWIVRSSSHKEDTENESNAGAYLSIKDVAEEKLEQSVDEVIKSYVDLAEQDEVLVQPMVRNIVRSGVAFSHDPNTNSAYRTINWIEGPHSDTVTNGLGGTRMWQRFAGCVFEKTESKWSRLFELLDELLSIFSGVPLDVEFAYSENNGREQLWLFQVRPLLLKKTPSPIESHLKRLQVIEKQIERGMEPHPFLKGEKNCFGVMPDWNPAEIIGIRPKPLALSLYRELITDSIWAYQRHNYGYRNLRSFPLLLNFSGIPYIDVRVSFNSFVPSDLEDSLANKLVNYYIKKLLDNPSLHDKIEFEIVLSCLSFDFPNRAKSLSAAGFTDDEINSLATSLSSLTNSIISPDNDLIKLDAEKLQILDERRDKIFSSKLDLPGQIYWLLEDIKRYGTLPFAGLARAGFIAVQMLKSMLSQGVFTQKDYDDFFESVWTVTSQLKTDRSAMSRTVFLETYGHLRPGTYDITSLRYDEAPDLYFDWDNQIPHQKRKQEFRLTNQQQRKISAFLDFNKFDCSVNEFTRFLRSAIELRELAKFKFTRSLSDMLVCIQRLGEEFGVDREGLAYSEINFFSELYISSVDAKTNLKALIEKNRKSYEMTKSIVLPTIIRQPDEVWEFEWLETEPNFITQKELTANVVGYNEKRFLNGSIVCIPSADPGFDWLFSHNIAGLITAWGGGNSHMAIRAGELQIPSIIGAGEKLFNDWSAAKLLYINCADRRVQVIR